LPGDVPTSAVSGTGLLTAENNPVTIAYCNISTLSFFSIQDHATKGGEIPMDAKDLKKYLAGLGIAGLMAGGTVIAADAPKDAAKPASAPTSTAVKSEPTKTAPAKSG